MAPALRGCVDDLKDDAAPVEPNRTVGVTDGCPVWLRVNTLSKQSCKKKHKCKARQREHICAALVFHVFTPSMGPHKFDLKKKTHSS